jgi:putative transcriptional regulator
MTERFQPTLLLSMPQLQDPNFARTVVLLCDFVPEGAFGLVLNRPTDEAATVMVRLDPPVENGNDLRLHTGGPVEPDRGWIVPGLFLSTSPILLRRVLEAQPAPRALVLAGYAGWGPGQLDQELSQSAWLMCDIDLELVFDTEPSRMWETAIRRLGADPSAFQMSHGVH